ncbi:MAG: cupin domain-containing protein [Herbiconiux sp.]|uniref:cupin domain-containing protein n=1 Tax=Herbiconiux sp. TaxID=1871186 RepID=UPI001213165C|nr:cupin domain-containing protein [Herbiconiux sp.]TAJ46836.1 MAG: cupin domain-containing protein [Herbiconiux sp.]
MVTYRATLRDRIPDEEVPVTQTRPLPRLAIGLALIAVLTMSGCAAPSTSESLATSASSSPSSPTATPTSTAPATDAPVVVEELGRGEQEASVDVEVTGPTQVAFRRITLKPGAGTGLHCHDGQLIAVVEQGTLTHYAPIYPGGVHVYEAGDSIIEGPGYVHEGKNEGTENVVLLVTYVIPDGDPLAETDLTHCDPR